MTITIVNIVSHTNTPTRTHSITVSKNCESWKWNFSIKTDDEKWSRIFYFEIQRVPSELLLPSAKQICTERLNWPGKLAGAWRGLLNFKIKDSKPFFTIIFKSKILISRPDILVHLSTELVWQKLRCSQKNTRGEE